jgi:phosphatidylserine decarboxylase
MTLAETLRVVFIPPHPAGRPFIAGGVVVLLIGLFVSPWVVGLGAAFTLFCLYFFRDPERFAPARPGAVVSPADGRVVVVDFAVPPAELGLGALPMPRVAIFLSVLNVHVNRMPVAGTVTKIAYHAGKFISAGHEKASDVNERNSLSLRLADGRTMAVVQIAGLIARRILCSAQEGQVFATGARFGIIRFGSRTDLYLPDGVVPLVSVGQTMIGGETVIATLT